MCGKERIMKLEKENTFFGVNKFYKRLFVIRLVRVQCYALIGLLYLTRICTEANARFESDIYTSSGELVNVFRMEQELVRIFN